MLTCICINKHQQPVSMTAYGRGDGRKERGSILKVYPCVLP